MTGSITTGPLEADAAAARAAVDKAEQELAGGGTVSFGRLHKLADRARHTRLAAEGERIKAEKIRAEQRAADLAELGEEVDALAVSANLSELRQTVGDVAAACARVHELADKHDAAVLGLCEAATALGVEPPAPSGPRESSGFIAVTGRGPDFGIIHRRTHVRTVAGQILAVLGQAQGGKVAAALELLQAADSGKPAWRPSCIARNPGGVLIAMDNVSAGTADQIRKGELTQLSEHEIDLWMRGEIS